MILGPTAGGKTQLAIDLALRLSGGGECISADSMQLYRGMDIGTAKPDARQRSAVPHHLLDIVDPSDDTFSVDRWLELCEMTIEQVQARARWPIVVGGTNLYVQALLFGLIDGPAPDPELRTRLGELDQAELRGRLERADALAASRIHPNDRKRTIRALEVFEQTGRPLSSMQTQWEQKKWTKTQKSRNAETERPFGGSVLIVGLDYPIEVINRRINARVKGMIEAGLVEEVRRLRDAGALGRNAREALGYKQILAHLDGELGLEDAIELIKIRTRRYAKQQRTWLRRFRHLASEASVWINADSLATQELTDTALTAISKIVDRRQLPA